MKKQYIFSAFCLIVSTIFIQYTKAQQIISSWNFENGTQQPTTGNGTLLLIGNAKVEWGRSGIQPGSALPAGLKETVDMRWGTGFQTFNYPNQGVNPKTAGIQINANTFGYKNILVSADVRQGGTSANKLMLQYTVDGINWEKAITYTASDNDTWYLRNFNFKNMPAVNNNSLFAIRFVTNFDDDVVGSTVYVPVSGSNLYSPLGSIRFDNIVIRGYSLNEPEDDRLTITNWNFDNQTLNTSEGTGVLSLTGGISYDNTWNRTGIFTNQTIFDQGVYDYASVKDGFGLQTFNYPVSGNSKTAGIQIDLNSVNYKDLYLSADVRHGGTSANKIVLQYSTGDNPWTDVETYTANSGDTWYQRTYDFSTLSAVNNKSQLSFRYVTAFDGLSYAATGFEKIYATTGPIRFDNIRLSGRLMTGLNNKVINSGVYLNGRMLHFTDQASSVSIYNLSGIQLMNVNNVTTINLAQLSQGIYIVVVDGMITKIAVQ
jgi:hypothetical protein